MTAITLNTEPLTTSRGFRTPKRGDARAIDATATASHIYIPSNEQIVNALERIPVMLLHTRNGRRS
jgi:hypothetical protein